MEHMETKTELSEKKDTFVYSHQFEDAGIYSPKGYEPPKNKTETNTAQEHIETILERMNKEQKTILSHVTYIDTSTKPHTEHANLPTSKNNPALDKAHMDLLQNFMIEERESYQQQILNERMTREFLSMAQEKKEAF